MASYLLKNVPKSNLFRQSALSKLQKRNTNSNASPIAQPTIVVAQNKMVLPLTVGVSLGIGVGLAFGSKLLDRYLPSPPKDPEIDATPKDQNNSIQEFMTVFRQINQLENQLRGLDAKLQERDHLIADLRSQHLQEPANTSRNRADVFELSQVIEANNLANSTTHNRELEALRIDLIREHMLNVEGEVLKVENKYRPVINKVKELEMHLETQNQLQQAEAPAKLLWISCQALLDRMRYSPQTPLEKDPAYDVLKEFAANKNPLAISVLDSIPAKALKEGVQSEESLIDRFSKVERLCKRVALVDETGGGITKYLVSYLQSMFIISNVKVTDEEVAGVQLVDPTSWNTFDIVARVRYCLRKHNIDQAVRYANQLRGQARVVARDWIRDARTHLETRQAFSTLSTHAEAIAIDAARSTFVK